MDDQKGTTLLSYLFAILAAGANAAASVLQRKANRDEPIEDNLTLRLIRDLLGSPVWFAGIMAVFAGFLLQAAALGDGRLAVVEPILAAELPITLLLAAAVFRVRLGVREWGSAIAMTVALAGLLWFLSPTPGHAATVGLLTWSIGIGANLGLVALLVGAGRRSRGPRRAALLGTAAGMSFGLTAALMKGMTEEFRHGFTALFTTWELWAMIAAGVLALFLLQSAMNSGRLLAAQPGVTLADPIVAIVWGILAFGESTRSGIYLLLAVFAGLLLVGAVVVLSRSPLLSDEMGSDEGADPVVERPSATEEGGGGSGQRLVDRSAAARCRRSQGSGQR